MKRLMALFLFAAMLACAPSALAAEDGQPVPLSDGVWQSINEIRAVCGYEMRVGVEAVDEASRARLEKELAAKYGDMVYMHKEVGLAVPMTEDLYDLPQYQSMRVASKELNVRSGPDAKIYPIIDVLKRGDIVEVVGESGKWLEIDLGDGTEPIPGYVHSSYLKPTGSALRFATERVNIREGNSAASERLAWLEPGAAVSYLKKAKSWAMVGYEYEGQTGYVFGKYLSKNRRDCFYSHPVAQMIGRENISGVDYSYLPKAPALSGIPRIAVLSVTYSVQNIGSVTVYKYASTSEALLVRDAIAKTPDFPDRSQFFYYGGESEIIVINNGGLGAPDHTKAEAALMQSIFDKVEEAYSKELMS